MAKTKSSRQVRFLLSGGSPLTKAEKTRLKGELHSGSVKVQSSRRKNAKQKISSKRGKFIEG